MRHFTLLFTIVAPAVPFNFVSACRGRISVFLTSCVAARAVERPVIPPFTFKTADYPFTAAPTAPTRPSRPPRHWPLSCPYCCTVVRMTLVPLAGSGWSFLLTLVYMLINEAHPMVSVRRPSPPPTCPSPGCTVNITLTCRPLATPAPPTYIRWTLPMTLMSFNTKLWQTRPSWGASVMVKVFLVRRSSRPDKLFTPLDSCFTLRQKLQTRVVQYMTLWNELRQPPNACRKLAAFLILLCT